MAQISELVRRRMRAWNVWRIKNLGARNLHGADLRDADLPEVKLQGANLEGADLSAANLREADLSWADLYEANLQRANLQRVNLREADLFRADLQGADLQGADLRRADLSKASLQGANLRGADLSHTLLTTVRLQEANLEGANLSAADLSVANLQGANLQGANLSSANLKVTVLKGTNFKGAHLTAANLTMACLSGANFAQSHISTTTFASINSLHEVQGLDTVIHDGPSAISIDTLIASRGKIPDVFLRGCGVPDDFIEYLSSLISAMQPIQYYSCFISYSTKDEGFAKRLHERMRRENLSVWFAPEDLKGGHKLRDQFHTAIQMYDKFLLILSDASMRSDWVADEVSHAYARERKEQRRILFPISLNDFDALKHWKLDDDDTGLDLAKEIRRYYIPDFSKWKDNDAFEASFARLLNDLKANDAVLPKR